MSNQPFYHLRPNKHIDRQLFLSILIKLRNHFDLSQYSYVGFGSYLFDDFKIMHNSLGIYNMISLEVNSDIAQRAEFNKPLNCIEIINKSSTEYIDDFDHDKENYIFWLDYTDPSGLGNQFSDFCSLLRQLGNGDILRITLNANPSSMGGKRDSKPEVLWEERFEALKARIGEFVPIGAVKENLKTNDYPKLLLKCLEKAAYSSLKEGPFSKLFPLLISSSSYADGQQMVTLTVLILDDHDLEKEILSSLYPDLSHSGNLISDVRMLVCDEPKSISIPDLTTKEILTINSGLPAEQAGDNLARDFPYIFSDVSTVSNYLEYYKVYPYFREVNF